MAATLAEWSVGGGQAAGRSPPGPEVAERGGVTSGHRGGGQGWRGLTPAVGGGWNCPPSSPTGSQATVLFCLFLHSQSTSSLFSLCVCARVCLCLCVCVDSLNLWMCCVFSAFHAMCMLSSKSLTTPPSGRPGSNPVWSCFFPPPINRKTRIKKKWSQF